jgi:hypothetical protein
MEPRDLPYQNSPFAHLAFLVSEALRRPVEARPRSGGWLARLDRWLWTQRQRAIEAYLAQSRDLADLERRMRDLDRQIASRGY